MYKFSDLFSELNLVDFPHEGGKFTWSDKQDPPSMSLIDRFLATVEWEEHFTHAGQQISRRPISDHSPILLDCEGMRRGKYALKFESM